MAPGEPKKKAKRSLKIKCPTWDHVESFYERKLRKDNKLPMRVPFMLEKGASMTIALELPNEMVMAIDGEVTASAPAADGKKSAIQLTLHGMTPEVLGRLQSLVEDSRKGHVIADAPNEDDYDEVEVSREELEPPAALPTDAPVDELVGPPPAPRIEDVEDDEQSVFTALDKELRHLRESAAHEVLGVGWDAGVEDIRRGYFRRTKRYHPDIFSRYRSTAIRHLAQEVFIHVNRAYDRMRDAAVANGAAFVAGPALMSHDGWLASFDDLGEEPKTPLPAPLPASGPPAPPPRREPPASTPPTPGPKPSDSAVPKPVKRAQSEPVVKFAGPDKGLGPGGKKLSVDSLFGDIDLGSNPAIKVPAEAEAAPEVALSVANVEQECRSMLAHGHFEQARESLAAALRKEPRNRRLRALYHVSNGRVLQSKDEAVQATAQFEAALAHDRECAEAKQAIEDMHKAGSRKGGLFGRIFK